MTLVTNAMDNSSETGASDGRRARGLESRRRIVMALIELIREGKIAPTAEEVSMRAKVGLRTVFRHFDDMETLYREIDSEFQAIVLSWAHEQYESGDWQDRLIETVKARGRLYESVRPFFLSGQVHRHESVVIDSSIRRHIELERASLKKILPKELLTDKPLVEALILLLSPNSWFRLRRDQDLSFSATVATLQSAAKALLSH
jgi:AcrR family transcriptional regulator